MLKQKILREKKYWENLSINLYFGNVPFNFSRSVLKSMSVNPLSSVHFLLGSSSWER